MVSARERLKPAESKREAVGLGTGVTFASDRLSALKIGEGAGFCQHQWKRAAPLERPFADLDQFVAAVQFFCSASSEAEKPSSESFIGRPMPGAS